MKSTEARQGNWVLVPSDTEIIIPNYPKRIKAITLFGEFDFSEPTYPKPFIVPAIHCAGIPLTEKILWEAGFLGNNPWEKDNLRLDSEDRLTIIDKTGYGIIIARNVKYVHQLQNLYLDLTGNDIEMIVY
jgi:hypothetical protein